MLSKCVISGLHTYRTYNYSELNSTHVTDKDKLEGWVDYNSYLVVWNGACAG